jgi:hypothetical protein
MTHSVCDPMLAEASILLRKSGTMPRDGMLHMCADDFEKKGVEKLAALNACETILTALHR